MENKVLNQAISDELASNVVGGTARDDEKVCPYCQHKDFQRMPNFDRDGKKAYMCYYCREMIYF